MPGRAVDQRFAAKLRQLRIERGLSLRALAGRAYVAKSTISDLENGLKSPTPETARALDAALRADGALVAMVARSRRSGAQTRLGDDEEEALELVRRGR
jgi:transcriptional regulator with XRE-family HTH domain